MIKKIIIAAALLGFTNSFAQQGTASPYSFYGFGEKKFNGANEIKSMGGLAVYRDSIHLNTLNPASYSKLKNTTFSMGASYKGTSLKNATSTEKTTSGSFDYLAVAFPAGKINVALGIMPYSFLGYNVKNIGNSGNFTETREYYGDGGLNRTFLGLSYRITNDLSIGLDGAYIFGETQTSLTKFAVNNGDGTPIEIGTRLRNKNNYSGFMLNAGINYEKSLNKSLKLYTAATFSPEMKLQNNQEATIATIQADQSGNIGEIDAVTRNTKNDDMLLPMNYTFGLGIGNQSKWFLGAEYTATQTSKYNTFYTYDNATYNDYMKIGFGGFITPKNNSLTSYLERMTYRAGVNYENTGLVLKGEEIKGFNANIGFGFPVGNSRNPNVNSNINIGFEYGQKGNTNMGLIKENYYGFNIGFSFNDVWFQRRKYN